MGRLSTSCSALVMGLALGWLGPLPALAQTPEPPPQALVQLLDDLEQASNQQGLDEVLAYYSDDFASTAGLDRAALATALDDFWQQYATLDYEVELLTWQATPRGYTVETLTRITGLAVRPERQLTLTAEIRSQQRIEAGQIVFQDTLTQRSQLTSGDNPPTLTVYLPTQLDPGETYEFDAIVNEPLNGRSLLGLALEEELAIEDWFTVRPLSLDVLSAGGLYKIGSAPDMAGRRWVSAVLVREDGLVVETRQLIVGE